MSKSKKHLRACPVIGKEITSAECGSKRGSEYACPADCPYFPFAPANYDQHGEIESRMIQKTYERAARLMTSAEREQLLRVLQEHEDASDEMLRNHARFAWQFHWKRDAEGRTFGERWLMDKAGGLSNDERVLLAGVNRTRPVLFEVQRICDAQTIAGVDLLDGTPLRIVDRSSAARALRYSVLLIWCYPMPHYERSSGGGLFVPEVHQMAPEDVVREIIRHLGGPSDPAGERAWLAEHFARTCEALGAVQLARWQNTMAAVDARYVRTDYRLVKGARLSPLLAKRRDLQPEPPTEEERGQGFEKGFVWLQSEPKLEPHQLALPLPAGPQVAMGTTVLGRVLLGRERVRVEAMSGARHQELRARFERLAAGHVEFLGERVDDLGAQTAGRNAPAFDPALVPPQLLEDPQRLTFAAQRVAAQSGDRGATVLEAFRIQYAAFLNESIPWLDDRTPRAAATDPVLRPRLVALMKTHIRGIDRRRREEGLDFDLNPLLDELGLHELISEPPPLGFAGEEFEEDDVSDGATDAFDELVEMGKGLAPHPVIGPISESELERRLATMHRRHPDPMSAVKAIDKAFPDLLDFAWDATQSTIGERDFPFLEILIVRACHVLKPPAGPVLVLKFERIIREFGGEFARASKLVTGPGQRNEKDLERWIKDSPQPVVMEDLSGVLLTIADKSRRKERPRDESMLLIHAFLKALVAELSRAGA